MPPEALVDLDDLIDDAPQGISDPVEYARLLRAFLEKVQPKIIDKLLFKMRVGQEKKMKAISQLLRWISLGGVLLLLMPLVLKKKYPNQMGLLFKYSALAALTFFVTVNLFAGMLWGLREAQGVMAPYTNPQMAILNASFDTLWEQADELVDFGPALIEPTLQMMDDGFEENMSAALLANGERLVKDAKALKAIGDQVKNLDWLLQYIPPVLTLLTVVLFLLAVRPVLMEIVALPARAASQANFSAAGALQGVFTKVGAEMLATLMVVITLVVMTLFTAYMLALTVLKAVEVFIEYMLLNIVYLQMPTANITYVYISLGAALFFVVLCVAVVILITAFTIGKSQKIYRQKFHEGVSFAFHKRFWGWGALAVIWSLTLPFLFMLGVEPFLDWLFEKYDSPEHFDTLLLAGPLVLVGGFLVLYWALRGFKALTFPMKYKVLPVSQQPAPGAGQA